MKTIDENDTMGEVQEQSVCRNDKFSERKKLTLTPELQRSSFGILKTESLLSDPTCTSFNGFKCFKNNAINLEENMELISKTIVVEREHFQNFISSLQSQVVQLEENNYSKSVKIENLQLYNSEKLKIIDSLTLMLDETKWKHDAMQQFCEKLTKNKLYKSMLLVSSFMNKLPVFKLKQENLQCCLSTMKNKGSITLIEIVQQLILDLGECIDTIKQFTNRELLSTLLSNKELNFTVKNIIHEILKFQCDDENSTVEMINLLNTIQNGKHDLENMTDLWEVVKGLFQKNHCLANKVSSLNMHKFGLQLQLDEMEINTKELELKTITEIEEVKKKEDMLNQNESIIQQQWDEMDISQEIVIQTQIAQEIDQELEDLQIKYHNLDKDNRLLKLDLYNLKNELTEYQLKCEQLDTENKQIEKEKNDVLETYGMSWGHHNAKQKIKYTDKLIRDIDSINQEIKLLELEHEKQTRQENNTSPVVRTSLFSKTQQKSDKTLRSFGVIDINKQQNISLFREGVVRNLQYQYTP